MPIPDFVRDLRTMIGTHPLWLPSVTAVVEHEGRVLLIRRADTGEWTPVTGIVDPGEESADAAEREVLEEAGVEVEAIRLAAVGTTAPVTYPNGDRSQFVDVVFRCRYLGGDPYPADGEALEAAWFPLDALPPIGEDFAGRIEAALADGPARFIRGRG